jgi:hypothetical protein
MSLRRFRVLRDDLHEICRMGNRMTIKKLEITTTINECLPPNAGTQCLIQGKLVLTDSLAFMPKASTRRKLCFQV